VALLTVSRSRRVLVEDLSVVSLIMREGCWQFLMQHQLADISWPRPLRALRSSSPDFPMIIVMPDDLQGKPKATSEALWIWVVKYDQRKELVALFSFGIPMRA
jgi:hypothetical protein